MFGFKCYKCGECCSNFSKERHVLLFPEDIKQICQGINMDIIDFKKKYCKSIKIKGNNKNITIPVLKNLKGKCIFLSSENLCLIHTYKPYQCKHSPLNFLWDNERSTKCLQKLKIPKNWSTEIKDRKLFSIFVND